MSYNFVGDAEALDSLYKTITDETANVKDALDEIYRIYESFDDGGKSGLWSGDNSDTFLTNVTDKKEEMYKCVESFNKFAGQINDAKNGVQAILTELC